MLSYETIFNRTRGKYDDVKELSLDRNDLLEINTERLHNAIGDPRVRRLFSKIILDDEIQQIDFELNNSIDEQSDEEFVIKLLVLGMAIEWLTPKIDSIINTAAVIGGKEEKVLINNHKNMMSRLDSMKKEQHKLIRDYGYIYNSYINGD